MVKESREKIILLEKRLNELIVGHEDVIRSVILSLVAKEHVVMISPPGTAKTMLAKSLAKMLKASFYKYLLTRFTSDVEILGAFDIPALKDKGELKRKWSNIKDAEIVFLDEIFKANSAILNSLLAFMQERILYDPVSGQEVPTKLWTLIGASNEVPMDEELQALYDRFAVRIFFDYISDDSMFLEALIRKWVQPVKIEPIACMDDVKTLYEYTMKILSSTIKQLNKRFVEVYHVNAIPLVKELRSKGVMISDRTVIEKLPKLVASYLSIYGVTLDNLMNAVYDVLPFLARTRDEVITINKVIENSLGEVAELMNKIQQAREMIKSGRLTDAKEKLEEVLSFDLTKIANKPWLKPRAEALIQQARKYHELIEKQLEALKALSEQI